MVTYLKRKGIQKIKKDVTFLKQVRSFRFGATDNDAAIEKIVGKEEKVASK